MSTKNVKYRLRKMSEQSQVADSTVASPVTGSDETTDPIRYQIQDVDTIKECHPDLEKIIDKLIDILRRNVKETIEVDGKEIPLDECAAKLKTLSSCGNLDGGSQDGNPNQQRHLPGGPEDTMHSGPTTKLDDYESQQIEMLKAEIGILHATLHDASEREQHYKILVGQLDMADSRAQQKWESFHNSVVQQWSNHYQLLQRQLSFTAMKLQQHMTEEAGEQAPTETENESKSTNEAICLESGEVSTAVSASAPPLSDSSEDLQGASDAQHPQPSARSTISGMPCAPFSMFTGHASPSPFPRMPFHDNCTSPYTSSIQPTPLPPPLDLRDAPFISEKMTSARQLHRFFTNLSIIEKAQREGRAYRNSDQDFRDQDTDRNIEYTEFGHNPRQARAYGNRYNDQYDEERVVESEPFLDAGSDDSYEKDTKPNRLTATAVPFIPANATRNIDEH